MQKLTRMLQLLCALHQQPRPATELAVVLGCSVLTAKLMVYDLRKLGCTIRQTGRSVSSRYVLEGWGVFDPAEVLRRYAPAGQSSSEAA
jgi:DNA-binding IclR family transcriptional regulator